MQNQRQLCYFILDTTLGSVLQCERANTGCRSELLLKAATGKWKLLSGPVFLRLAGVFGWFIVSLCNGVTQIDRLAKIMRCEGERV